MRPLAWASTRHRRSTSSPRERPAVGVCFTPLEIRPAEVAVVVYVLRATSTIVQALAAGYPRVLCCRSVATARYLRADGRVLAGERDCVRVPDFELGNSPAAVATAALHGEELVLATTNGSPAIVAASSAARRVLIGSLLNLHAVLHAIRAETAVTIVCSGTDGRPGARGRVRGGSPRGGPRWHAVGRRARRRAGGVPIRRR